MPIAQQIHDYFTSLLIIIRFFYTLNFILSPTRNLYRLQVFKVDEIHNTRLTTSTPLNCNSIETKAADSKTAKTEHEEFFFFLKKSC